VRCARGLAAQAARLPQRSVQPAPTAHHPHTRLGLDRVEPRTRPDLAERALERVLRMGFWMRAVRPRRGQGTGDLPERGGGGQGPATGESADATGDPSRATNNPSSKTSRLSDATSEPSGGRGARLRPLEQNLGLELLGRGRGHREHGGPDLRRVERGTGGNLTHDGEGGGPHPVAGHILVQHECQVSQPGLADGVPERSENRRGRGLVRRWGGHGFHPHLGPSTPAWRAQPTLRSRCQPRFPPRPRLFSLRSGTPSARPGCDTWHSC